MTEPTKKEMLEWLDNCSSRESCAGCEEFKGDCGYVVDTIRKLIESMPEPGGGVVGSGPCKPQAGGSIPPSGSMTDEEAVKLLNDWAEIGGYDGGYACDKDWEEARALAITHISARLAQKPKVTREQVKEFIPCTCLPEYKDRDIKDPYCAYHSENWEGLLLALGLEVEE